MSIKSLINLGTSPDSGTGDSIRRGGQKINTLFADIYANLGDLPVGNDPDGPFYGYRRQLAEFENRVGEIHAAGKQTVVSFSTSTGKSVTPKWYNSTTGYDNTIDSDNDLIPDIYRDSEWYFLSRGEAIVADLSKMNTGRTAHLVLPLAQPGDTIIVNDTFNTWTGKFISIWATPYEFKTQAQLNEWIKYTPNAKTTGPDSDALTIVQADGSHRVVPFKATSSTISKNIEFKTNSTSTFPTGSSPLTLTNATGSRLTFTYRGNNLGWGLNRTTIIGTQTVIEAEQDYFTDNDWVEWNQPALTVNDSGAGFPQIELQTGWYVLGVSPRTAAYANTDISTNTKLDSDSARVENATTAPIYKVFRKMGGVSNEKNVYDQVVKSLNTIVDSLPSGAPRTRLQNVLGDSDTVTATTRTHTGFRQSDQSTIYKEIQTSAIVDGNGNILLISQKPYSGFVQIYVPQAENK